MCKCNIIASEAREKNGLPIDYSRCATLGESPKTVKRAGIQQYILIQSIY